MHMVLNTADDLGKRSQLPTRSSEVLVGLQSQRSVHQEGRPVLGRDDKMEVAPGHRLWHPPPPLFTLKGFHLPSRGSRARPPPPRGRPAPPSVARPLFQFTYRKSMHA